MRRTRQRTGTPSGRPARRWPWAVTAVLAGAAAGASVAYALRRTGDGTQDAGAEQPLAVVDRPDLETGDPA